MTKYYFVSYFISGVGDRGHGEMSMEIINFQYLSLGYIREAIAKETGSKMKAVKIISFQEISKETYHDHAEGVKCLNT